MKLPRLLLADDHALIVEGLRRILESHYEIVGICKDGRDLVTRAESLQPDVIVLDVSMPGLNGIEAARQLRSLVPGSKIVFVTQKADREYAHSALELGASAYVLKQSISTDVLDAVQASLEGRFFVSPALRAGIPEAIFPPTRQTPRDLFAASLTPRQREVLQLVAEGRSAKEIANALNISVKTVDYHKAGIMDELGLRTTAELTKYAITQGIVGV